MNLCRGPLPDGHPRANVIYFCPDQDVALLACHLAAMPCIESFRHTDKEAVLLDAHRAPDEWFSAACKMPRLTVQGDPDAMRPQHCSRFAAELSKAAPHSSLLRPHLKVAPTLTEALAHASGRTVVAVGTRQSREQTFAFLRPNGLQKGDGVMDFYGRFYTVDAIDAFSVHVDGGRRVLRRAAVDQHVVVSPSSVRSGEYDTVIVMPDVPERIGQAMCRRNRYQIVAVAHSPFAYVEK